MTIIWKQASVAKGNLRPGRGGFLAKGHLISRSASAVWFNLAEVETKSLASLSLFSRTLHRRPPSRNQRLSTSVAYTLAHSEQRFVVSVQSVAVRSLQLLLALPCFLRGPFPL
jgi:hypothetical protein